MWNVDIFLRNEIIIQILRTDIAFLVCRRPKHVKMDTDFGYNL